MMTEETVTVKSPWHSVPAPRPTPCGLWDWKDYRFPHLRPDLYDLFIPLLLC